MIFTGGGGGLSQAEADARYLRQSTNLSDLAAAATARSNLGISAANTPFTPAGSIAATDVQAALAEVDGEKLALAGGTVTGAFIFDPGADVAAFAVKSYGSSSTFRVTNAASASVFDVNNLGFVDVSNTVDSDTGFIGRGTGTIYAFRAMDNGRIAWGADKDVYMVHDGSNFFIEGLPAADPSVTGALYWDSNVLTRSA